METNNSLPQNTPPSLPANSASFTIGETYTGPLPHPAILQGYAEIDSSFPERVFVDFEQNSKQHREQELIALQAKINDTKRSQWMAFAVIVLGIVGTLVLAYLGKDAASVCTALATGAMIFKGIFVRNNN